jgi:uncharacterized membrane protein YraQ (UPF0718 family)
MESLITKALPIGTILAFCMSTLAASVPEFILLKQLMTWRLLAVIFSLLLASFTVVVDDMLMHSGAIPDRKK